MQLGWAGVFPAPASPSASPLVYEVSLGTLPGAGDVLHWVETLEAGLRVAPLAPLTDYHLTVTAVNAAGLFDTVSAVISSGP